MKKILITIIFGYPLLSLSSPHCLALEKKNLKRGVLDPNPKLSRKDCTCPCTCLRLKDTTCLECDHKQGPKNKEKSRLHKQSDTVDLVLTTRAKQSA